MQAIPSNLTGRELARPRRCPWRIFSPGKERAASDLEHLHDAWEKSQPSSSRSVLRCAIRRRWMVKENRKMSRLCWMQVCDWVRSSTVPERPPYLL